MVIELQPPTLRSSPKISKFCIPAASEHQFHKTRIKNWLPIGIKLGSSCLGIHSQELLHYGQLLQGIKLNFYIPIHKVLE